jgi:hypothetical protein
MAGLAEHYAGTVGDPAPGVRGTIIHAEVSFHFDDSSRSFAVHQDFAEAIAGDFDDGASVEMAGEDGGIFQELIEKGVYARRLA